MKNKYIPILTSRLLLIITIFSSVVVFSTASELNETVKITPVGIKVPLNRIIILRANSKYCAIKFTKFWTGQTNRDFFAKYETFYQGDKTGEFSKENLTVSEKELSFPNPRGIGRFAFSFGKKDIVCGPIELLWFGEGNIHFFSSRQEEGDYGVEMAPTKWTDISQVNVFDKRLTWYRYDPKRNNIEIPIDELWSEGQ
jgi:hypothetical protein